MKEYEMDGPPDYSKACWLNNKFKLGFDFPNLPYIIHGDHEGIHVKLTESMAIHRYLAEMYEPKLLGTNPLQKATVNMLADILSEINSELRLNIAYDGDID